MCSQQSSASLMKLRIKADSMTPASPDRVAHIEWADRRHGSEVQVLASPRLGEALPGAKTGLLSSLHQGSRTLSEQENRKMMPLRRRSVKTPYDVEKIDKQINAIRLESKNCCENKTLCFRARMRHDIQTRAERKSRRPEEVQGSEVANWQLNTIPSRSSPATTTTRRSNVGPTKWSSPARAWSAALGQPQCV